MSIIVSPTGRIVNVEDENQVNSLISKERFRAATLSEIEQFRRERNYQEIPSENSVFFISSVGNLDGYGQSSLNLLAAMRENKVEFSTVYNKQELGILYSYPTGIDQLQTDIKLIYTMWEATRIPETWPESLHKADRVFVPSKFCQDAFLARGVETELLPLGYDHNSFYLPTGDFRKPEKFRFLHYDAFNVRKGWDIVFKAFNAEFKAKDDVELVLKTTKSDLPIPIPHSQYPKVTVLKQRMSTHDLRELIWSSHCFVFPSRGEGFGLTPLENLACGTPAIIPNGSGMSEYFDERYFLPVTYKPQPAIYQNPEFSPSNVGEMIRCDQKSVQRAMREAYENRDRLEVMGIEGAAWARTHYSIGRTAKLLSAEIERAKKDFGK